MITVDTKANTISGPFTREELAIIESLPERPWRAGPDYRFVPSMANVRHLWDHLPEVRWLDEPGRQNKLDAMEAFAASGPRPPDDLDRDYAFRTQPIGRQLEAFAFGRFMKSFALFNDPGTGKTWCALNIAAAKFEADEIDCLLIVAPNGVHAQWIEEQIPRHLPDVHHAAGHGTRSVAVKKRTLDTSTDAFRILAVNVEAFSRGAAIKDVERFVRSGRCMIVVDEATRIKNWSAKRTKALVKLAPLAVVRAVLTGTPITKGLVDLFPMLWFLDPDILGFSSFRGFRDRYCVTAPAYRGAAFGHVKIVGHKNVPELMARIAPYCFRITKEGLPEKVYETRRIELTPEQRTHYNSLVREFRAEVEGGEMNVTNAAARTVRLQQILSGVLVLDEGEAVAIPENRSASLVALLDELGDAQVVVWTKFHADADRVAGVLNTAGISHVVCDGRSTAEQRAHRKEMFAAGGCRVFVANPAAMGTGTDGLQVAPVTVFYSHTFDAEQTWQAEDRTHREGMVEGGGVYYRFVAPRTVDELVLGNVADKRSLAERIVDDPAILREA